jgi:hypothetical protein
MCHVESHHLQADDTGLVTQAVADLREHVGVAHCKADGTTAFGHEAG